MGALASVRVHDDLAAGEAGVSVRPADHELAGGIHVEDEAVDKFGRIFRKGCLQAGDQDFLHVEADFALHGGIYGGLAVLFHGIRIRHLAQAFRYEFVVLGAQDDGMHFQGLVRLPVVLDGELALGIRSQVGHQLDLVVADIGEDFQQFVAQVQRKRHVVFGVPAGVAEHHALVAGALLVFAGAFHAAVDVGALFMQGAENAAAGGVEHVVGLGIADPADGVAHGGLDIHIGLGLDLSHNHDHAGRAETLAGHFGLRVLFQKFIQDGVADLVRHFVRVPFGHRFRCKQVILSHITKKLAPCVYAEAKKHKTLI